MVDDLKPLVGKRARSTRNRMVNGVLLGLDGPDYGVIEYDYPERGVSRTGRSLVHREDIVEVTE